MAEYIREWLNSTEQRVNGRCTFCYADGHDCAVCWRLRPDLRPPQWKPYNAKAWIYDGKTILPDKDKKQTIATPSKQVAGMTTETGTFDCSFNGMALSNKDLDLYDDKVIGYMNDLPFSKTYQPALNYATIDAKIIHRRYAHCGKSKLIESHLNTNLANIDFQCEACNMPKARRIISHPTRVTCRKVGDIFYADVQSVKPTSIEGYNYFTVIVDDKSRQIFTVPLMTKGQASDALIQFCKEYKLKSPLHIYPTKWKLDGGKELKRFRKWATKKGMEMDINPPRTPEMNDVPRRIRDYIAHTARTMIIDSRLPPKLWQYAVETATYITNRLPNTNVGDKPLAIWRRELLINQETSLDHVRIWGSKVYIHIPKEGGVQAEKMVPRAFLGHLVGYEGDNINGHVYKVWVPSTNQVKRSQDVIIKECDDDGDGRVQTFSPTPMLIVPMEQDELHVHEVLNPTTTSEHSPPPPNNRPHRIWKNPSA